MKRLELRFSKLQDSLHIYLKVLFLVLSFFNTSKIHRIAQLKLFKYSKMWIWFDTGLIISRCHPPIRMKGNTSVRQLLHLKKKRFFIELLSSLNMILVQICEPHELNVCILSQPKTIKYVKPAFDAKHFHKFHE